MSWRADPGAAWTDLSDEVEDDAAPEKDTGQSADSEA